MYFLLLLTLLYNKKKKTWEKIPLLYTVCLSVWSKVGKCGTLTQKAIELDHGTNCIYIYTGNTVCTSIENYHTILYTKRNTIENVSRATICIHILLKSNRRWMY